MRDRIEKFRGIMGQNQIDAYIIPTADYHQSEYVDDFFKTREYLSGFTGSAGTLVITHKAAGLWTDGRYFLQAEQQLKDTGIELYRMGMEGVWDINRFLSEQLQKGQTLGFDAKTVSVKQYKSWVEGLEEKGVLCSFTQSLENEIWKERPKFPCNKIWLLPEKDSGESLDKKLLKLRNHMKEEGLELLVMNKLDEIAWLFNMRGNDVAFNPVFMAYCVISSEEISLFVQKEALGETIRQYLKDNKVRLQDYGSYYEFLEKQSNKIIGCDFNDMDIYGVSLLEKQNQIINRTSFCGRLKAVKNLVEQKNMIKSHVEDGLAVTRFMIWLKNQEDISKLSEQSVAEKQEEFRKMGKDYLGPSFETISAYGEHGAVIHYSATKETNVFLQNRGFLLMDSGGQYLNGTTDITRTFVLGSLSEEEKKSFTLVLKSMLSLMNVKFLYGTTGYNLDISAREPLWKYGMDFRHGTGHGVGYILNVHEGPNAFRWKIPRENALDCTLEEGMITTDEPGFYQDGEYGIRLENVLLCKKGLKNPYGQFMEFQTLTCVPIDLEGADMRYLNADDVENLNRYHHFVYETLSPLMEEKERQILKEFTRAV